MSSQILPDRAAPAINPKCASAGLRQRLDHDHRILGNEFDRGRVDAELSDRRIVGLPLRSIEGLVDVSLGDLDRWRLSAG